MRLILAASSFLTLSLFVGAALLYRSRIPRRMRRHMIWVQAIIIYILYGNVVAYRDGYEWNGWVSWFGLVAVTGLSISIMIRTKTDGELPPNDGSLGQRVIDSFVEAHHYWKDKKNV